MRRVVRWIMRLLPSDPAGDHTAAVRVLRWMGAMWAFARRPSRAWPPVPGTYVVGTPDAPVAVCTLGSASLMAPLAALPGVAIAGRLRTVNLGIERIVRNVTANPAIRLLLVCGTDSPVFFTAQGLRRLVERGVDADRRIVGAHGPLPVLSSLSHEQIDAFRQQVTLIDRVGEQDVDVLAVVIRDLAERSPTPALAPTPSRRPSRAPGFEQLHPGGPSRAGTYDPQGFFVITIERDAIVLRHYLPDHTRAHEMRGRTALAMLQGLLREGLVSQLDHAGYLGVELARAEAALRFDLVYEQDQPLRARREG